jgi:ribosomal-protein-alanine N-acetyltransferase
VPDSASVDTVTATHLVPLEARHLAALREAMGDADILRFTRTPDPIPEGWVEEWLAAFDGEQRYAFAIVDGEEQFLGYAVTGPVNRKDLEVELGYAVAPAARGRGVATQTLRQLTRWAFDQGMQRVTALISPDNHASSRVAQNAGYTFEGVLRSVHHIDGRRGDLQSWSILPGELADA